ncbi:DUF6542 domain-containing protein [Streptomyces xiamenensis]|uniref:DUF6542 domain-containing protein n=1 Tax=Streptomyces xiamenensis TaxID=408015 RepID=UPI0036F015A5
MVRTSVPRPAGQAAMRNRPRTRPVPPVLAALSRLPRPRLTGLGCGVLATVAMVGAAWLCEPMGGAPSLYGVLFILACAVAALWVRPADLICAPVAAPIAFAIGLVTTLGPMAAVTELALRAPWLFGGTATAAGLALLRGIGVAVGRIRRRRRRAAASR